MPMITDEPCPWCKGSGKVTPPNEEPQPCPWCKGTARHRTAWTTGRAEVDGYVFHMAQEVARVQQTLRVMGTSSTAIQDFMRSAAFWFEQLAMVPVEVRNNNLLVLWATGKAISKGSSKLGPWLVEMVESYAKVNGLDFTGQVQEGG